jgi:hypothetical protein
MRVINLCSEVSILEQEKASGVTLWMTKTLQALVKVTESKTSGDVKFDFEAFDNATFARETPRS